MNKYLKVFFGIIISSLLLSCSNFFQPVSSDKATTDYHSQISDLLRSLPPPKKPIVVAIYKFRDQTGQYKSNENITQYSTAVTQGSTSMLIRALMEAGNGQWFTVLEREGLTDLMNERKIINQTREAYIPEKDRLENKAFNLPPMLYAPVLLEGGVIAYETNLLTGGAGARYFGIGGSTEFRRDTVTTMLRAVAVQNGEVLTHVDSRKTILSMQLDSGLYRFVSYQRLLELEAGITSNEPPQMAVLESIEACVYAMVIEGLIKNSWELADPNKKKQLVAEYLNTNVDESKVGDLDSNKVKGNITSKSNTNETSKPNFYDVNKFSNSVAPKPAIPSVPKSNVGIVPTPNIIVAPKQNIQTVPKPNVAVVPKPNAPLVPSPNVTVAPKSNITTLPKPNVTVVPKPNVTTVPKPNVTVVPKPNVTTVPKPNTTVAPKQKSTVDPRLNLTIAPDMNDKVNLKSPDYVDSNAALGRNLDVKKSKYAVSY